MISLVVSILWFFPISDELLKDHAEYWPGIPMLPTNLEFVVFLEIVYKDNLVKGKRPV